MNQLVSQQAGGALVFKGTVSEPVTVTVGGKPATVTADNRFEGQAVVPGGTAQVAVTATDPSGNTRTSTYQVSQAATSKSFTYDANGNMTSDGTRTYEWDAENQLVAVKEGAATVASHTYNAGGIRTSKTVAGVTTTYLYEGINGVEERRSTGSVVRHYQGPGIDNVLAMQDGAGLVTHLTRDHLGSIREHTSTAGVVMLRRDYDAWGDLIAGASEGGWAFTGRENEPESGLHYYRARYYSPNGGRFVSEDPAGRIDGPNRYAYVANNPVRAVDPQGLAKKCWDDEIRVTKIGTCTARLVSASKFCPDEAKDVCGFMQQKIAEKGYAELYPAVCGDGEKCCNQTPQTEIKLSEDAITIKGCKGAGPFKVCCRLEIVITGEFVGTGKIGGCGPKKK